MNPKFFQQKKELPIIFVSNLFITQLITKEFRKIKRFDQSIVSKNNISKKQISLITKTKKMMTGYDKVKSALNLRNNQAIRVKNRNKSEAQQKAIKKQEYLDLP